MKAAIFSNTSVPLKKTTRLYLAFYTMAAGSFQGVKRLGRDGNHPSHIAPRLKDRTIPLLCAFMVGYRVSFTFYTSGRDIHSADLVGWGCKAEIQWRFTYVAGWTTLLA